MSKQDNGDIGQMVKIDKDIPAPPARKNRVSKYPLLALEVGESFVVDPDDIHAIRSRLSALGAKHNRKFTARKIPVGLRIWRIT